MESVSARRELPLLSAETPAATTPADGRHALRLEEFFERINNVTLKLTSGCNLRCVYCNAEADSPHLPRMSLDRFRRVASLLVENSHAPFLGLEFHGGEPLLLPDEWFEEAVAYGSALARQHQKRLGFAFVTNGTLLTDERLARLAKLKPHWCMSIDGSPEINDSVRGGGHAVERAVRLFQRQGIKHSVLTVLSRGNWTRMAEVMDWFRDVGVWDIRINFVQPQGRGNDEAQLLTGEEMFEGMRQVLDHMDRTHASVLDAEMGLIVERFLYGRPPGVRQSCWEVQCAAGRSYVAVDHEGVIRPCGSDGHNHALGHIDGPLDLDHYNAVQRRLHDKGDWVIRCFDCDAKRVCRHSCPTSDFNSPTYREYECRFTKLMYKHLCEHPEKARRVDAAVRDRKVRR